jgi:hypothetical protein
MMRTVRSLVWAASAWLALQWPAASEAAALLRLIDGSENRRSQQFERHWTEFLIRSLDSSDERRRLVAAQMVVARASIQPAQDREPLHTPQDLARAVQVRTAVRAASRDAITLTIAASHCKPSLSDSCDRLSLFERAASADPDNGWTWLQLGGELAHRDLTRVGHAFDRAVGARTMNDAGWLETVAALYVPLRRERPDIDADLALMNLNGLAAAAIVPALQFVSSQCSEEAIRLASRKDDCRRLVRSMAAQARTALSLHTATRVGQRLAESPELLGQWQARADMVRQSRKRLPFVPTAAAREIVVQWGDDLVVFGELEAAARLLQRP